RFKTENLRLHCSPVVNLFSSEAEPIRMDGYSSEYRVMPSVRYRKSMEAYEVEEVTGIEEASGKRHAYAPYFRFRDSAARQRHFIARRHSGLTGRPEITLTLTGLDVQGDGQVNKETLSIQLTCTNGSLPKEKLVEGMINQVAPEVPQTVTPSNLTQPTLTVFPPTDRHQDFFWKLISHWSLNYVSIATREALTGLLALYDWTGEEANRKRLAGISDVRWAPKEILRRGSVLRGAEVTVTVLDGSFYDEGDLNLFGIVLSEFLSMYATINSFVHLVLELSPSGRRYEWQPMHGAMPVV
ncbi:MAG TPA: type VI secretion system baseplate subunit TssF, partial [Rhodothermales bacterium]|nr:type VI secretion system baseplate subunit TssF [Rhodothermales bacterium]